MRWGCSPACRPRHGGFRVGDDRQMECGGGAGQRAGPSPRGWSSWHGAPARHPPWPRTLDVGCGAVGVRGGGIPSQGGVAAEAAEVRTHGSAQGEGALRRLLQRARQRRLQQGRPAAALVGAEGDVQGVGVGQAAPLVDGAPGQDEQVAGAQDHLHAGGGEAGPVKVGAVVPVGRGKVHMGVGLGEGGGANGVCGIALGPPRDPPAPLPLEMQTHGTHAGPARLTVAADCWGRHRGTTVSGPPAGE